MNKPKTSLKDLAVWLRDCPFPIYKLTLMPDEEHIEITLDYPKDSKSYELTKGEVELEVMQALNETIN